MRLLVFFILFYSSFSYAEYRVFQLSIVNAGTEKLVMSTLDDLQYPEYYPLNPGETISYKDSWMCYDPTFFYGPYCPKPSRQPANTKPQAK